MDPLVGFLPIISQQSTLSKSIVGIMELLVVRLPSTFSLLESMDHSLFENQSHLLGRGVSLSDMKEEYITIESMMTLMPSMSMSQLNVDLILLLNWFITTPCNQMD
jgi:hypothetical protein